MSARAQFVPGSSCERRTSRTSRPTTSRCTGGTTSPTTSGGIVAGLDLGTDEEGNLAVQAGVAFDGFGRELVLAQRQGVGRQPFDDRAADVLDVYLNDGRFGGEGVPTGFRGCDDDGGFDRWQEQPFLTFEEPATPPVDRRRPDGVLEPDADFRAERHAPGRTGAPVAGVPRDGHARPRRRPQALRRRPRRATLRRARRAVGPRRVREHDSTDRRRGARRPLPVRGARARSRDRRDS